MALAGGSSAAERRKTHENVQEKVNSLWTNVKLFEKGVNQFTGRRSCVCGGLGRGGREGERGWRG